MKQKDWRGDTKSVLMSLGAARPETEEREAHDYYATDPVAAEWLLKIEDVPKDMPVWECAAGELHLSKVFDRHGYRTVSTDLVVRTAGVDQFDFLAVVGDERYGSARCTIITNPPYKYALQFVQRALGWVANGCKVCMFLRLLFLESKERGEFFRTNPPRRVWVASKRILCAKNGEFGKMRDAGGSAMAFAWFVWEKGYEGPTEVCWFN